ncbi:magnesium/cobalt transporter CorA [Agriterribacter sp.]|uniref:magnesium/cobalt transporter CorA n=1 Tax=Agriterribacter sp. TaxID=2821509 RepID=UPI002CC752EB|nr:magnesium/cobalt transporter CorA [Agriterribacter sp.]HRO44931.1 magnesium/cobalt transporter CorA [Agriterribacter sp.]HRQ15669.1 magnesium/cobalt transporter CorA [Agriterribacter sp.]
MKEIINCAAYAGGQKLADIELNKVHDILKEKDKFVWIGLYEPSEAILSKVQDEFNLHDLAIEDAHRAHQRPKIELYGDSIFVVLRTAQMNQERHIEFGETHFFVGMNFIVSIRHGSSVPYTEVRSRCETMPELLGKGQGFVLYAIMDFIVDKYFPVVEELEQELDVIEDKIFKAKPSRETTEQIYELKRELLEVKRAVSPLIDICNRLMRFDIKSISTETQPYFRDIYDHAVRINEMIDNTRELLNTALEANFSLISISQNDTSKKFAGWAAIIAMPTMIAGFYGMNFKFMPELEWHYGYYAVIILTIAVCSLLYYFFRKSGWL